MADAARGVAEGLSPKGLADTYRSAKNDIFVALDELQVEQFHQTHLIDGDFRRAVAQRHDEALDYARLAATEFVQRAEPPEVDFGHFTRQALRTPHADRGNTSEIAPFPSKAIQTAIGDHQSLA